MPNLSGGNFEPVLVINGGRIAPSGSLDAGGNIVDEVYIWVVQMRADGSGAAFATELKRADLDDRILHGADPGTWSTAEVLEADVARMEDSHKGEFQPGPALGLGVVVATIPGQPPRRTVSTWTATITLKDPA